MKIKFQIYPDWPQYIADLTLRFGDVYFNLLDNLIAIKQKGGVEDYINSFELA